MNSRDVKELEEARDELIRQKEIVYAYVGDEIKDLMVAEDAWVALAWSGDAMAMVNENENLAYSIPEEGTNLWFDNVVIPYNAKNVDMANKFIDYLNRPDIAARNSEYVEYATANIEAKKYLPEDMQESPIAFPDEDVVRKAEVFRDPHDMLKYYNDLWIEVKAAR